MQGTGEVLPDPTPGGAHSAADVNAQAREVFALWTARRVSEPDSLRARASTIATAATAAAAGTLVALVGRAQEAAFFELCMMGVSLVLFVAAVGAAFRAITRPFNFSAKAGIPSSELIEQVGDASQRECSDIRPWLTAATWLGVVALALALVSLLLVVAYPKEDAVPRITVLFTPEGRQVVAEVCSNDVGELTGELERWNSTGVVIRTSDRKCPSTKLWLPQRLVAAVHQGD